MQWCQRAARRTGRRCAAAGEEEARFSTLADKLLQTGAALGVAKTGGKLAVNFVRRNPAVAVATGIGVGLLALVAYRKRKQDQANGPIEGKSRRVEARKVNGTNKTSTARKTGTPRKPRSTTRSAES